MRNHERKCKDNWPCLDDIDNKFANKKKSVHEEPEPTKSSYMESVSLFEYAIVFFYNHRRQPSIKVKQNNLLGRGSYNEEPFNKEVMK